MTRPLDIVIFGLSISSAWGNGHATTFRALVDGLAALGHRVLFVERDQPWYARHRDLPDPPGCTLCSMTIRPRCSTGFGTGWGGRMW